MLMKPMWVLVSLCAISFFSATFVYADSVSLNNASFEIPILADDGRESVLLDGWTVGGTGGSTVSIWNPPADKF
ncbi:MAG: hypothetical protein GX629_12785, partial [Phycisphaerae bacterium]|nr:hypothetical protein [Phycisphaerae bacterium]